MLLVIADTGPIRYLVQIGHIDLLQSLFQTVSIPAEVSRELGDPSAPPAVQAWIKTPPRWLSIHDAVELDDPALDALDAGERAAIALGISLKADLILVDERKGSVVAANKGFETTGTLGILDLAAKRNLLDLRDAIERLKQTNFRYRRESLRCCSRRSETTNSHSPRLLEPVEKYAHGAASDRAVAIVGPPQLFAIPHKNGDPVPTTLLHSSAALLGVSIR
jgi:predicted nucleic acid-binding protein